MCGTKRGFISASLFLIGVLHSITVFAFQGRKAPAPTDNADPVILDMIEDDGGTVEVPGEFILVRLYSSGRVEFEDLHDIGSGFKKHQMRLDEKEVERFIADAQQPDFLKAAPRYNRLIIFTDMWTNTRITLRHGAYYKEVEITNYSPDHPRAKEYYPPSLMRLMQSADRLREDGHGRK